MEFALLVSLVVAKWVCTCLVVSHLVADTFTGTGIAMVSALHAKVPVLLHDRSKEQVAKGLSLVDKLLAKDVGKGKLTETQAKEARDRLSVVDSLEGLRDVDMVVEVRRQKENASSNGH